MAKYGAEHYVVEVLRGVGSRSCSGPRGKMNEHADKDRILGYHIFIPFSD